MPTVFVAWDLINGRNNLEETRYRRNTNRTLHICSFIICRDIIPFSDSKLLRTILVLVFIRRDTV